MQHGLVGYMQMPFSEESLLELLYRQELEKSIPQPRISY